MLQLPKDHNGAIYLSGGMQFADQLGAGWRDDISKFLRDRNYIPFNITELDVAYADAHGDMYRALEDLSDLSERKSNIRRHYIYADTKLIRDDTDAVIVYYDESVRRGAGTISECQIAYDCELPLFLVNAYPSINDVPGWLQALTTRMFNSFDELKAYFDTLPNHILRRDQYGNNGSRSDLCSHYLCSLTGEVFQKTKTHFVSKISPLYSPEAVEVVKQTYEQHKDRYEFFIEHLNAQLNQKD
jgi:hypothetical protein